MLLRCVQSPQNRFRATVTLEAFRANYQDVGRREGRTIYLSDTDKEKIRAILLSEGINPKTPPDAWRGITRADALTLGNNEKLAGDPVKRRRVAIKALTPAHPIKLNGQVLFLPPRCHLDLDFDEAKTLSDHDWIVVVENWECFNDIHIAASALNFPGANPLVVWRGDTSETRIDAMLAFLEQLSQPVAAFVDYDPAGLVIAGSLPRLSMIVTPSEQELEQLMQKGLPNRYLDQIGGCQGQLDHEPDPTIARLWSIIRRSGRALPQEHFVRSK